MSITDKEFYTLADRAHFFGAATLVLWTACIFPHYEGLYVAGAILIFAAVKEFYWDPRHESVEEAGSGLRDFLGYLLGVLFAVISAFVRIHFTT